MAGRVDDVDAGAFPFDRGRLGQDGDAALFFEIVAVHRPLFNALIVAERTGLAEKLIDEGGLAVIDVRDDRDITQGHVLPLGYGLPWPTQGHTEASGAPLQEMMRCGKGAWQARHMARFPLDGTAPMFILSIAP